RRQGARDAHLPQAGDRRGGVLPGRLRHGRRAQGRGRAGRAAPRGRGPRTAQLATTVFSIEGGMPGSAAADPRRERRLTERVARGGCAGKLGPGQLAEILRTLPPSDDPRVLVDFRTGDDAGVYRLADGTCLVQTVDFFTPVVDDPDAYGAVAAAN